MDLLTALSIFRRRWPILILCLAAGVLGGYSTGHRGQKQYAATAQCYLSVPGSNNLYTQLVGTQLSSNLVSTYATLVNSQIVRTRMASMLTAEGITTPIGGLGATVEAGTYIIDIRATGTDPQIAQTSANTAAKALVASVSDLQDGQTQPVKLKIVGFAALPGAPFTPKTRLDLLVGLILGLFVGLAGMALMEALDRTIRSVSQADALLDVPLLGLIPKHRRATIVVGRTGEGVEGEPYRSLRTATQFLELDKPVRTILITSPTPRDGKSTTAANLAVVLAIAGDRVIVVDADLRRGGLATAFGVEPSVGLTSLVLGTATLDEALQTWSPNLKILPTGPLPPNPSEILGSEFARSLLAELKSRADVVIIDAPPVLPVADAVSLSALVDGAIIVLRHGRTARVAASATGRRLNSVNARVFGYVLNGVPRGESRAYNSGYGYAPKPEPAPRGMSDNVLPS